MLRNIEFIYIIYVEYKNNYDVDPISWNYYLVV